MANAKVEEKLALDVFIKAYVKAQKAGNVTIDGLCTELKITQEDYNSLRNRMTAIAREANITVKPLLRKERNGNEAQKAAKKSMVDMLLDAFKDEEETEKSEQSEQTTQNEQTAQ